MLFFHDKRFDSALPISYGISVVTIGTISQPVGT
jgi:hypothetical protein